MMDLDCFLFITFYAESFSVYLNLLEGSIPEEIFNARNMIYVYANHNNFNGTLSTRIGQMVDLQDLAIESNYLTGTIPTQLGQLTKLRDVRIYRNDFSGEVPKEICDLKNNWADLFYIVADCLEPNVTLPPKIDCQCCDGCCDGVHGGFCPV
jgi:hypothetical protein